jgi:hypothetical protein
MKLEKGQIIEITIPKLEKPVKAVVLDIIATGESYGDFTNTIYYTYILYTKCKLFKVSNECQYGISDSYTDEGEPVSETFEHWTNLKYKGTIIDNCIIPNLSLNI